MKIKTGDEKNKRYEDRVCKKNRKKENICMVD